MSAETLGEILRWCLAFGAVFVTVFVAAALLSLMLAVWRGK